MKVGHRFAKRSLNPLDENGQEGCAQCGLGRGAHPDEAPLVPKSPPVFDAGRFERMRQSYEMKVDDLRRETLRYSAARALAARLWRVIEAEAPDAAERLLSEHDFCPPNEMEEFDALVAERSGEVTHESD